MLEVLKFKKAKKAKSSILLKLIRVAVIYGLSVGWLFPSQVFALEIVATILNASDYTSNTLREEGNEIGEWIHKPGIDLKADQLTTSWAVDADYSYLKRLYEEDIWQDETVTTGKSSILWRALPNRLDFYVNNSRVESSVRALQAITQSNRQMIASTQSGAKLQFQPRGKKDSLQLTYAYIDTHASKTQTDSVRENGTLGYLFKASTYSSFQLMMDYSDIEYEGAFPDAIATVASMSYIRTTPRLDFEFKYGRNWFDRTGSEKVSDGTYDLSLLWRASTSSTITLNAFSGIVDKSISLQRSQGQQNENSGSNAAFIESRGNASLTKLWGRTTLTIGTNWSKQSYPSQVLLDNDSTGYRLNLSRKFTRNMSANLSYDYSKKGFGDQRDEQVLSTTKFRVTHRLGRAVNILWGANYTERKSNRNLGYKEWGVSLQVRYTFIGAG